MTATATAPHYCAPAPEVLIVGVTRDRNGSPMWFDARVWVEYGTQNDVAATWPKTCRMRAGSLSGCVDQPGGETATYLAGTVRGEAKLLADGVNGGANETGKRRARAILRAARKAGMTIHATREPSHLYDVRTGQVLHRVDAELLAEVEAAIAE